ncbi:MAG: hypothetical protein AAF251_11305 [Pseudomonadota bacterium]
MEFDIATISLEIIKDDDEALSRIAVEKTEERHHTGTIHEIAAT